MMTSFVRRFSLSTSPTHTQSSTSHQSRRESSDSNGRVLGARDYKLANTTLPMTLQSPSLSSNNARRGSEITLTNDMDTELKRPNRILGARDYQQAISAEDLKRRRSSIASTLMDDRVPALITTARTTDGEPDAERVYTGSGGGRIYGARDYKLLKATATARKMSAGHG